MDLSVVLSVAHTLSEGE